MAHDNPSRLCNDDLIDKIKQAAAHERGATAQLVTLLAEFDARRLYLGEGCASLFAYCTSVLHLSEHAAYHRIEAARAARQFPVILERLAEGALTLAAIGLLRPHLTAENHLAILDRARHQSKREVERLIATLAPEADVPSMVRRLPVVTPLSAAPSDRETSAAVANQSRENDRAPTTASLVLQSAAPRLDVRDELPPSAERYLLRLTISGHSREAPTRPRSAPARDPEWRSGSDRRPGSDSSSGATGAGEDRRDFTTTAGATLR